MSTFLDKYGKILKVHLIGINGISMSGLAEILLDQGYIISGSDLQSSDRLQKLEELGATIYKGHSASNVKDADLIVYSAAVESSNPEIIIGKQNNIPTIDRATLLGGIMEQYNRVIAISGTHGKTSTTSMISSIFLDAKADPTIHIGAKYSRINGTTKIGSSDIFIAEACEYKDSFLKFKPSTAVILNIEFDHADYFRDINHVKDSFIRFTRNIRENGNLIINYDDSNCVYVAKNTSANVISYGINNMKANWTARNIEFKNDSSSSYDLYYNNEYQDKIILQVPGMYNISNSLSAIACSRVEGIDMNLVKLGLKNFTGADRRFQLIGEKNNIKVINDYAHHPTEIVATLSAASFLKPNNIICIFQPHTYTRTLKFIDMFSNAFNDASTVIITDIYAAREADNGLVHSKDLVKKLINNNINVKYIGDLTKAAEYAASICKKNDIILTMGAGDIETISKLVLENI